MEIARTRIQKRHAFFAAACSIGTQKEQGQRPRQLGTATTGRGGRSCAEDRERVCDATRAVRTPGISSRHGVASLAQMRDALSTWQVTCMRSESALSASYGSWSACGTRWATPPSAAVGSRKETTGSCGLRSVLSACASLVLLPSVSCGTEAAACLKRAGMAVGNGSSRDPALPVAARASGECGSDPRVCPVCLTTSNAYDRAQKMKRRAASLEASKASSGRR
mmetsp:Transcript_19100/g.41275  ORF Transcript_19100/g.41275 Transcript_19100/m.41275 type:complete len:223 (+) Transcript_19100:523-1191(+)